MVRTTTRKWRIKHNHNKIAQSQGENTITIRKHNTDTDMVRQDCLHPQLASFHYLLEGQRRDRKKVARIVSNVGIMLGL